MILLKVQFSHFAQLQDNQDLFKTWQICTKVKDTLENGSRLENLSWRLFYRSQQQQQVSGTNAGTASRKHGNNFRKLDLKTTDKLVEESLETVPGMMMMRRSGSQASQASQTHEVSENAETSVKEPTVKKPQKIKASPVRDRQPSLSRQYPFEGLDSLMDLSGVTSEDNTLASTDAFNHLLSTISFELAAGNTDQGQPADERAPQNTTSSSSAFTGSTENTPFQTNEQQHLPWSWDFSLSVTPDHFVSLPPSRQSVVVPGRNANTSLLSDPTTTSTHQPPMLSNDSNPTLGWVGCSSAPRPLADVAPPRNVVSSSVSVVGNSTPPPTAPNSPSSSSSASGGQSQQQTDDGSETLLKSSLAQSGVKRKKSTPVLVTTTRSKHTRAGASTDKASVPTIVAPSSSSSRKRSVPVRSLPKTTPVSSFKRPDESTPGPSKPPPQASLPVPPPVSKDTPTVSIPKSMVDSVDPSNVSCQNCGAKSTPTWRVEDEKLLCNACGLYYRQHQKHRTRIARKASHPKFENPVCADCNATHSPLWRQGEDEQVLCNACGLYKKQHPGLMRPLKKPRNSIPDL